MMCKMTVVVNGTNCKKLEKRLSQVERSEENGSIVLSSVLRIFIQETYHR